MNKNKLVKQIEFLNEVRNKRAEYLEKDIENNPISIYGFKVKFFLEDGDCDWLNEEDTDFFINTLIKEAFIIKVFQLHEPTEKSATSLYKINKKIINKLIELKDEIENEKFNNDNYYNNNFNISKRHYPISDSYYMKNFDFFKGDENAF